MEDKHIEEIMRYLGYLEGRWKDEWQYEDFNDYCEGMSDAVEKHGLAFISLTKKPFQCKARSNDGTLHFFKAEKGLIKWYTAKEVINTGGV